MTLAEYFKQKLRAGLRERHVAEFVNDQQFDGGGTSVFGSQRLTGALLDRLTHHVHILVLNGESYRLKQSTARRRRAAQTADEKAAAADPEIGEITPLPERRVRPGCEVRPSPPGRTRPVEFYAQPQTGPVFLRPVGRLAALTPPTSSPAGTISMAIGSLFFRMKPSGRRVRSASS